MLRGRIERTAAGGSALIGTVGWHPGVVVFSAVWLGLVSVFVLIGAIGALVCAFRGTWSSALGLLGFAGGAIAMGAFFFGLVAFADRSGKRDEEFLLAWLSDRLRS